MPINVEIQNKVLKIAANKAVDSNVRLAVRKQFYDLKSEEISLESVQETFNGKVAQFNATLDSLLKQVGQLQPVIDTVEVSQSQKQPDPFEEIIVPKKTDILTGGVKVRMQEELDNAGDDTDFEVPFEVDES
jgi:hypothetical protein